MVEVGGVTYLATPKRGQVTPLSDFSSAKSSSLFGGATAARSGFGGSTSNSTSVTVMEGDTHIAISGASVRNEADLVDKIAKRVSEIKSGSNERITDKLRGAHRS